MKKGKENNDYKMAFFGLLGIVAIVAIISLTIMTSSSHGLSLNKVSAEGSSSALAGQAVTERTKGFDATSCKGDAICEMYGAQAKTLQVATIAEIGTVMADGVNVESALNPESVTSNIVSAQYAMFSDELRVGNPVTPSMVVWPEEITLNKPTSATTITSNIINSEYGLFSGEFRAGNSATPALLVHPENVYIHKATTFSTLSGSGNAYACLDASGVLFRSQTPCN